MGIFGWSLPPGCSGTPYDEAGEPLDLTALVKLPDGVIHVWWDEDGNLIETFVVTIPADDYDGSPEYSETRNITVGVFEWNDDLYEVANCVAAAAHYNSLKASACPTTAPTSPTPSSES
jgi:hypothetical protein